MSCSSCQRRRLVCDLLRPRCAQCRRSHLKCEFKPSNAIQFQDETETVKVRSFSAKRHKKLNAGPRGTLIDASDSGLNPQQSTSQIWQTAGLEFPFIDSTSFIPWVDDIFEGYLPESSGASQLWQDIADSSLFPDLILEEPTNLESTNAGLDTLNAVSNPSTSPVETQGPELLQKSSQHGVSEGPLEEIPDHFLAQHYTRNLTSRYSSKDRGWNYYAHFYHRFTNSHPFVLSALYAWTSAHLYFASNLKSLHNAFKHYERCLEEISAGHSLNMDVLSAQVKAGAAQTNLLNTLSDDDVDAIGVSMYFLASTDLLASRRAPLQNLVQAMAALHLAGLPARRRKGLFSTVSSWFCFLDARLSMFGMGYCSLMKVIGGEEGMVAGINSTSDFLRQEYKILYPAEEIKRDEAHLPLLEILVRLVANFGLISNFLAGERDPALRDTAGRSLDKIKKAIDNVDEEDASRNRVLSTFLTTAAFYHATRIYHSRAFEMDAAMYSADTHAAAIILITDKLYRELKYSRRDPPPTKMWPIPLLMAAIEAKDPIYRDWAMRKIADYSASGEHFSKSILVIERVWEMESDKGRRANIANVIDGIGATFVL